jgi:hypothetical protein
LLLLIALFLVILVLRVGLDIGIHALNNGVVGEDGLFPNSNPYIIYKGENVNGTCRVRLWLMMGGG